MNWDRAARINQTALNRIVAALVALLGFQEGCALGRIPLPLYRRALRMLVKTESAVRRLIVIAARALVVPPAAPRAIAKEHPRESSREPNGVKGKRSRNGRKAFRLFDKRQRLVFVDEDRIRGTRRKGPRIWGIEEHSPRSIFLSQFPSPQSDGKADAERLGRRLAILKAALENLPHQAKRMARWRARQMAKAQTRPAITYPMRPGPPPGHRKRPREDIDHVLIECHALAWDALRADTS
jgi:hypothetical protein